jgi:hypothetical protein
MRRGAPGSQQWPMRPGGSVSSALGEKRVAIENAGLRLNERVGAKAMLIDFNDQLAVAAKSPERTGRQGRFMRLIECATPEMEIARWNTIIKCRSSDARFARNFQHCPRPVTRHCMGGSR